jgi:hypothetical protein
MGSVSISAAIMAHPRRADSAEKIRASCPELDLTVVLDPDPTGAPSTLRTSILAWSSIKDHATHHLVVQDDVELCADIAAELQAAVAAMPASPIYIYTDWGTKCSHLLRLSAIRGAPWVEAVDPWVPAQAVLLPVHIADDFLKYVAQRPELDDDAFALTGYLNEHSLIPLVSMPNLVEHSNAPSLLGHDIPMGTRRATCFGRPDDVPIDWGGAPLHSPVVLPDLLAGRAFFGDRKIGGAIGEWNNTPACEWLTEHGISVHDQITLFRAADTNKAIETGDEGLEDLASPTLHFQFWLTGFIYGAIIATWPESNDDWLTRALHRSLAKRALSTIAPGALRELIAPHRLAASSGVFLPLVIQAMRQGLHANAHGDLVS